MLSKTEEYALRIIACLSRETALAERADTLADQTKVPRRYLNKVLKGLVEAGLIASRPGPGGGYSLVKSPSAVSILDVVNAVDPVERIRHCPLGLTSHTQLCPLHKELDKAYAATEASFASVTMEQLLKSDSTVIPLCDGATHNQCTAVKLGT